ncbi:MAG: MFS transporter, partial [Acidimicrobiaceae bacterium]|nr:MFS transporter [Acidimicrobiaceae bacterium]
WVVGAYALAFASLMLPFGTLADRLGRRRVMAVGLLVFGAGSILGVVSTSAGMLIGARVVMGIGAAASEPGTLSMIRHIFPETEDRAQALGVWAAVSGLALAAGPVIGGLLVGVWSWRGVFAFNVAVAVAGLVGAYWVLPESREQQLRSLDVPGFILGAVALVSATFATMHGEAAGFAAPEVLALYVVAAVTGVLFVFVERRAAQPILDLRFFRVPAFVGANVVAFTTYFALFAVFFFVPLYLQLVGSASPYHIALLFLPLAVVLIAGSALNGRWVAVSGPTLPMTLGCVVSGVAIIVINSVIKPNSGLADIGWLLALAGAGLSLVIVPANSTVLDVVPSARSGMAASAVNTSRELGAVAGVAVLGAIVNAQLTVNLNRSLIAAHIPKGLRELVITAVTTGNYGPGSTQNVPTTGPTGQLIQRVLNEAEGAFTTGLNIVLLLSGALMLASMIAALATARHTVVE